MLRNIYIKLTKYGPNSGPFNIYDQFGNLIAENITLQQLIDGVGYLLDESVTMIKIVSQDGCAYERWMAITPMTEDEFFRTESTEVSTGCVYRHLTNPTIYNKYYGTIRPYIIEYPFAYEVHDEIVQNIKDFSKVYRYLENLDGMPSSIDKIEVDDEYFNEAIVYNGQHCSGMLLLVAKPRGNLRAYMAYPILNTDSKSILFTKSDSFYNFNDFWDVVKDKGLPLFVRSCESLSLDKELNQVNMDYGTKSFQKAKIRGKEVRVRLILNDKSDLHIVSRLLLAPAQISYK